MMRIRVDDVDLDACRVRITQGKGAKDRIVPFPSPFKETLARTDCGTSSSQTGKRSMALS